MIIPEIEKGIEIPPKGKSKGRGYKFPFKAMDVGDSFFVQGPVEGYITRAVSQFQKRSEWSFTTRKVDGGVRVWRIS